MCVCDCRAIFHVGGNDSSCAAQTRERMCRSGLRREGDVVAVVDVCRQRDSNTQIVGKRRTDVDDHESKRESVLGCTRSNGCLATDLSKLGPSNDKRAAAQFVARSCARNNGGVRCGRRRELNVLCVTVCGGATSRREIPTRAVSAYRSSVAYN